MAGHLWVPGPVTGCLVGQVSEWYCGAQQTLYQEWLWVDGELKKRANSKHMNNGEETSSPHIGIYIGAAVAVIATVTIAWLLVILVQKSVKRRDTKRRELVGFEYMDDLEEGLEAERIEREEGRAPTFE